MQDQFPAQLSGENSKGYRLQELLLKNQQCFYVMSQQEHLTLRQGVLILSLLQDMSNTKGTTVVIVTHNAILAEAADKVIRIKNGQIESIVVNDNPKLVTDLEW